MVRIERVDSGLQRALSEIINYDLRDPRIDAQVTVMKVETTKDLKSAKVFVSATGTASEKNILDALESAKGYLRKALYERLKIRAVPELTFRWDKSLDYSFRVSELLKEIHKDDE